MISQKSDTNFFPTIYIFVVLPFCLFSFESTHHLEWATESHSKLSYETQDRIKSSQKRGKILVYTSFFATSIQQFALLSILSMLQVKTIWKYLVQSTFFGVVKNSNRRTHCTETWAVEKDIGPSMGIENWKLVCTKSATTSWWSLWTYKNHSNNIPDNFFLRMFISSQECQINTGFPRKENELYKYPLVFQNNCLVMLLFLHIHIKYVHAHQETYEKHHFLLEDCIQYKFTLSMAFVSSYWAQ